jgi:hypothetical protein
MRSDTPIATVGDLFRGGPPGSCPRKHPRFPERQPAIYVYVGGAHDRATLCAAAEEALGDAVALDRWAFGPRFVGALSAKRDAAEGEERARLTRLCVTVGVHLSHVPGLALRILERRAVQLRESSGAGA